MSAGLYALKPWYTRRLGGIRAQLADHQVRPDVLSWAGVGFGAAAGLALMIVPAPLTAVLVAPLLAARLAAANLDGGLARQTGRQTRWGSVVNELGDRLADLAAVAGLLALVELPLALGVLLATTMPSWIALAGVAAGGARVNTGPMGKTERCLLLVAIAAVPAAATPLAWLLLAGALITAVLRGVAVHRELVNS